MPQIKSQITAWIRAYRPLAFINIQFPLLFGASLGAYKLPADLPLLMVYGCFLQGLIVFWNDAADAEADRLNDRPTAFSGGSRVIPDRLLTRSQLMRAAGVMLLGVVVTGLKLASNANSGGWLILILALAGPVLIWMYSFPPCRLNYRGGGEALQVIGCGLVLPLLACLLAEPGASLMQAGGGQPRYQLLGLSEDIAAGLPVNALVLVAYALLQMAVALAATLPDLEPDRHTGKHTLAVRIGRPKTHWVMIAALLLGWLYPVYMLHLFERLYIVPPPIVGTARAAFFAAWLVLGGLLFLLLRRPPALVAFVHVQPLLFALPFILPKAPSIF